MMDLDARARSAAQGVRGAVDDANLMLEARVPGMAAAAAASTPWWAFAAGAVVAGAIVVPIIVDSPVVEEPEATADVTTTIVAEQTSSSVAQPDPPVVQTTPTTRGDAPAPVPPAGDEQSTTTVADTTPPPLEITFPEDGYETEDPKIEFVGTTEPGARVFAGDYEATVEADGTWSIVLILSPGENSARFVAEDPAGNRSEAWVTATLVVEEPEKPEATPPPTKPEKEPTTTTTVAPEYTFTAKAVYLECAETPPFDVYYGTGKPGAEVFIASPYGSGSTVVNKSGDWEVKVFFPEAPFGKTIEVVVEASTGHRKVLPFTRVEVG